jgi:hypothetical protein
MKSFILMAALLVGSASAKADRWLCNMTFKADVSAAQFIVGKYSIDGKGRLYCESTDGEKRDIPVRITGKGNPVALRVAFAKMTLYSAGLNLNLTVAQPEDLLGKYRLVQAQVAVGGGIGAYVATHGTKGATLQLTGTAIKGDGVNLGYSVFRIVADDTRE